MVLNEPARPSSSNAAVSCEICQRTVKSFNHHMRAQHPGCGTSNSRHGYRSNGQYVDGWFGGTCGTGTPYYLLCINCRKMYMDQHKEREYFAAFPQR